MPRNKLSGAAFVKTLEVSEKIWDTWLGDIGMFLVGAFPLREKCPTIAVTVFFLQTTILALIGPLFRNNPETT